MPSCTRGGSCTISWPPPACSILLPNPRLTSAQDNHAHCLQSQQPRFNTTLSFSRGTQPPPIPISQEHARHLKKPETKKKMSLIQFLSEIPTELRFEILRRAGGRAAANLSLTCQKAKELVQGDDELWITLCEEELSDVRKRIGYDDYVAMAKSKKWCSSGYGWFRHVDSNFCSVCLWFCSGQLVSHGKIRRLCTDCQRDIRAHEKMYDV